MEPPLINAERIALLKPMEEVAVDYAVHAGKNFLVMVDRATSFAFVEEAKQQTISETIRSSPDGFTTSDIPGSLGPMMVLRLGPD